MEEWETFFSDTPQPPNFNDVCRELENFCMFHKDKKRSLVLVTSGGTTVPLERNTVRFVDNFSAGTRGAASTEYFLSLGYATVFLNRERSLQPFERHLEPHLLMNLISEVNGTLQIQGDGSEKVQNIYFQCRDVKEKNMLLKITFVTLSDYLWFLRAATQIFNKYLPQSLLYLAAAVSDFYIPEDKMCEHKIQSENGPLNVTLQIVPKMLKPLVSLWGSNLYIVSFKLETDSQKLISKAQGALERYKHNLVIGNLLITRRREVTFVSKENVTLIELSESQLENGMEIEELIVKEVCCRYEDHMKGEKKF